MAKKIAPIPKNEPQEGKERTSVYLRADIMKSIRLIAVFDETSLTDIMEIAMLDYIVKWESKHGALPKKPAQ